MMSDENKTTQAAVYVGWTTFKTAIMDGLSKGLPLRIDRSLFPGQSGGVLAQLMAALKFLGLIDEKGVPTTALHKLTHAEEAERKKALDGLLRDRYAALFEMGLERATMSQLAEQMGSSYAVTGDTREKAIRFFISAAEYAGISIGPHISAATVATRPRRRMPRKPVTPSIDDAAGQVARDPVAAPPASADQNKHTIKLESGGELTVSTTLNVFTLTQRDRQLVFAIIDMLASHESREADEPPSL